MARYLVESTHTAEECLKALDCVLEQGSHLLARYDWGCADGDHTGWIILEANAPEEAQDVVPEFLRSKVRIVGLNKFSIEQVRALQNQGL